jgi:hypothetical protein
LYSTVCLQNIILKNTLICPNICCFHLSVSDIKELTLTEYLVHSLTNRNKLSMENSLIVKEANQCHLHFWLWQVWWASRFPLATLPISLWIILKKSMIHYQQWCAWEDSPVLNTMKEIRRITFHINFWMLVEIFRTIFAKIFSDVSLKFIIPFPCRS